MQKFRFQLNLKPKNREEYDACVFLKNQNRKESIFVLGLIVEYLKNNKDVRDMLIELNDKLDRIEKNLEERKESPILEKKTSEEVSENILEDGVSEEVISEEISEKDAKHMENVNINQISQKPQNSLDENLKQQNEIDDSIDTFLDALK